MRKSKVFVFIKLIAVSLIVLALVLPVLAQASVPGKVLKSSESVFRIIAEYYEGYGTGSGFVVAAENGYAYIATNYHVVEDKPSKIVVVRKDGEEIDAKIFTKDEKKDIAVLKCQLGGDVLPLVLNASGVEKGDAVYAVGFPGAADIISSELSYSDEDITITDGIASSVRSGMTVEGATVNIIQTTAPINPGNSGGPLLNGSGEVIGINTYGTTDVAIQGINWAISVDELIAIMEKHNLPVLYKNGNYLVIIISASAAAIAFVILIIVILIKRKKVAKARQAGDHDPRVKYCRKCGSVIVPRASFCNKCGTKF